MWGFLHCRLKESDLKVSVEKASEVAKKTERELFHLFKDTENKYKNKYRSLMFNLKDTKNNVSTVLYYLYAAYFSVLYFQYNRKLVTLFFYLCSLYFIGPLQEGSQGGNISC